MGRIVFNNSKYDIGKFDVNGVVKEKNICNLEDRKFNGTNIKICILYRCNV